MPILTLSINHNHLDIMEKVYLAHDQDRTSPVLAGLCVSATPDTLEIVSTNGIILLWAELHDTEYTPPSDYAESILTADCLKALRAALPKRGGAKKPALLTLDTASRTWNVKSEFTESNGRTIDGVFPRWKPAIPTTSEPMTAVGIKPQYLAIIAKVWEKRNIRMQLNGHGRGMTFRPVQYSKYDINGLIMPVTLAE